MAKINYNYLRPLKAETVKKWMDRPCPKREDLKACSILDGTILPLKKFPEDALQFGRGGVMDAQGAYVEISGIDGRIAKTYPVEHVQYEDKKVVYLGYLINQWGHFLVEAVTRLWYFLKNDDSIDRYVFFVKEGEEREIKGNYKEFFELLGIWDHLEIINRPVKYREVIVPERSFVIWQYWSDKYKAIFDKVAENVQVQPEWEKYDKIFLSRSRIPKFDKKEFNMEMLDEFFGKNGYRVIYPEHHSLANLIYLMRNADEIATLSGSVEHNMMFALDGVKHLIIEKTVVTVDFQIFINQMKNFDVIYIDANLPIYPISIGYGPYIMRYSGLLSKFAEDHHYLPADPKFEDPARMKQILKKYWKAYLIEYQYQWFLMDWEQPFIAAIREAYREGFEYFKPYLTRQKPFLLRHYFDWTYWKNNGKYILRKIGLRK